MENEVAVITTFLFGTEPYSPFFDDDIPCINFLTFTLVKRDSRTLVLLTLLAVELHRVDIIENLEVILR